MSEEIQFVNDKTNAKENAQGSDGRLNVSSRSDERIYYNSRDRSQTYTMVWDNAAGTAGDFVCSLFNDRSDGQKLVLHSAGINTIVDATFKLHRVTGPAGGGAITATPAIANFSGETNVAKVTGSKVANSDSSPISGLVSTHEIDHKSVGAYGHEDFETDDVIRLGEGQGIAIEMDTGASGTRSFGAIYFFFE